MIHALQGLFACALCLCMSAQQSEPAAPAANATKREPLILLYDDLPDPSDLVRIRSADAQVWVQVNQDPKSYETGVIDLDVVMKDVQSRTGGYPAQWMMLDFEEPFFADLAKDPDSPERKRAVASMLSTLRAMKQRWPGSKWTFYGLPNLQYWVSPGQGWSTAPQVIKRQALENASAAVAVLLAECDWVSVSIYDVYDPRMVIPGNPNSIRGTPESVREDGRAWRIAQVGLAKLLARGKPVIPTVCPFWSPGGVAPYCRNISPREFIQDQIMPAMQAGASGFALWTGMNYRIQVVTQPATENPAGAREKNFGQLDWRRAFTADYLGGRSPENWSDPQIRQRLVASTSRFIADTLNNIRAWERAGIVPPAMPKP